MHRQNTHHTSRAMSAYEITRLLATARRRSPERSLVYATLLYTGLRPAELAKVHTDQVIFDHALPHIRLRRLETKFEVEPLIPIARPLWEPLREWIAERQQNGPVKLFGVFKTLPRTLQRDLAQAAIPNSDRHTALLDVHAFRQTHAALLLNAGVDSHVVRFALGLNYRFTPESHRTCISLKEHAEAVDRIPDFLNNTHQ